MLDLRLIRENPEAIERALVDRGGAELIRPLLALDAERRRLVRESEELKALRNKASEAIGGPPPPDPERARPFGAAWPDRG